MACLDYVCDLDDVAYFGDLEDDVDSWVYVDKWAYWDYVGYVDSFDDVEYLGDVASVCSAAYVD